MRGHDPSSFEATRSLYFNGLNEVRQKYDFTTPQTPDLYTPISDMCNAEKRMKTTTGIASNNDHVISNSVLSTLLPETKI